MTPKPKRYPILILGGYGVFGSRIARRLAHDPAVSLLIAGRSEPKTQAQADAILAEAPDAAVTGVALDIGDVLDEALATHRPKLVIHTVGPFQDQDYRVAESCIARGIHYLDLADDRAFVAGFDRLDAAAQAKDVLAVSGASTVPGLTSAVIESLRPDFARMRRLSIGITPGNRAPRGPAVVASILSYTGKPIPHWRDGRWTHSHGWQDLQRRDIAGPTIGALGTRWFVACDVPDIALFPERYPELETVSFHAGLELALLHFGLWASSWPVRLGLVRSLAPAAKLLHRAADLFEPFGSDRGGMHVEISGDGHDGTPVTRSWNLIAGAGHGPWIPAMPAIILARKLAHGKIALRGALPCCNLIDVAEFAEAVADLDIAFETV